MSWVTIIWSMVASASLTLGAMHLLIWFKQRKAWPNLLFFLSAEWPGQLHPLAARGRESVAIPGDISASTQIRLRQATGDPTCAQRIQ